MLLPCSCSCSSPCSCPCSFPSPSFPHLPNLSRPGLTPHPSPHAPWPPLTPSRRIPLTDTPSSPPPLTDAHPPALVLTSLSLTRHPTPAQTQDTKKPAPGELFKYCNLPPLPSFLRARFKPPAPPKLFLHHRCSAH